MEHFSRAVTDYAFIAELLSEATNRDALSLRVCMSVRTYIHTYVCIYVYPFDSTQDTLIAQLPAVCRCHARQLGFTLHHHWPRIGSLYHFIAVRCIQLCLVLKCVLNDWGCVCHFGCGHAHRVARPLTLTLGNVQYEAGLVHKYVGVNWTAHTPHIKDNEAIQPTVWQAHAQERYEQERYWACSSVYVLLCYWPALLRVLSVYSSSCIGGGAYRAEGLQPPPCFRTWMMYTCSLL